MAIIYSYFGLAIAFLILATMLLAMLIKSNLHILIKVIIIPLVIWYSLTLYYTPYKLLGWPTTEDWVDGSVVEHYVINEPNTLDRGGFYFWLYPPPEKQKKVYNKILDKLNPKIVFSLTVDNRIPRIYYMPYDKKFHEMLTKKNEEKKKLRHNGRMRLYKDPKKSKSGHDGDADDEQKGAKVIVEKKSDFLKKPPIQ